MEDMKQVIVNLINEQNTLEREITLDNAIINTPNPITDLVESSWDTPGTYEWIVPASYTNSISEIEIVGGGGGSGGTQSNSPAINGSTKPSGAGGNGERNVITLRLKEGDVISLVVGKGGNGGWGQTDGSYGAPEVNAGNGHTGENSTLSINGVEILNVRGGGGGQGTPFSSTIEPWDGTSYNTVVRNGGDPASPVSQPDSSWGSYLKGTDGNAGGNGLVRIANQPRGMAGRNTRVKVDGIDNRGYTGSTDVFYTRGDMSTLFQDVQPKIRDHTFTAQKVIDAINLQYGLYLTLEDTEDFTLPDFTDAALEDTADVVLSVKENNWLWVGSVTVKLIYGNPSLGGEVLIQLMPVLEHPDDPETLEDRNSAVLCTYEFDFTAWKDDLQIDPETGMWKDFSKVLEVGARAGLGSWQNGYVVDKPTSEVPEANPRFERVMIQQYARGNVKGPIYFHYDLNW